MEQEIVNWQDLNLQSMDLILCAGESGMSKRIRRFQWITGVWGDACDLSHVGAIRVNSYGHALIQESTSLNKWADKSGVQENLLHEWLPQYNGKVFVRKLDFERTVEFNDADFLFWMNHKDDPYEHGIPGAVELLLCVLRMNRFFPNYTPKITTVPHCTELDAWRLKEHDLMLIDSVANRLPPWMWWSMIDDLLKCPVGKPIRIK